MSEPSEAAARFVRALASLVLHEGDASAHAHEAHAALQEVLATQKSLVLDVQFTGFSQKGHLVGGVDPLVLRASGHLITLRLNRVGFTPDASVEDLETFGSIVSRSSVELGVAGAIGALVLAQPHGLYASTGAGDVYKPPTRTPAAPAPSAEPAPSPPESAAPAAEAAAETPGTSDGEAPAATPAPGGPGMPWDEEMESTELAEFEFIDDVAELSGAPAAEAGQPNAPSSFARAGDTAGREEPPSSDMYHFFRTTDHSDQQAEALPRLLHEASTVTRFDELADSAARTALTLLKTDAHGQAIELLDALIREAERPDRTRFFRESALQALRRAGTTATLQRLLDQLPYAGADRDRILRFFVFLGADALLMLEGLLYRGGDPELRASIFRALLGVEGTADRLISHAVQDPNPVRTRTLLELASGGGTDPEIARRWAGEAAAHRDAAVRVDAARTSAAQGGRGALRILVDLLNDPERLVRREAIAGLGTLGESAAVPFLARLLNESDEELQAAAAASLGRIGSGDALPALLGVVQKRSLLQLKKATRGKVAALHAIAKIDTPAAREALASISQGRDELAEEARRILATAG
ncbi:MAG TPA: HEAT repeat domain-containing protein [Longimicrobium sp.]|nr:HEAT repeat domain-containing protein [Longimicrobium sp.]